MVTMMLDDGRVTGERLGVMTGDVGRVRVVDGANVCRWGGCNGRWWYGWAGGRRQYVNDNCQMGGVSNGLDDKCSCRLMTARRRRCMVQEWRVGNGMVTMGCV